MKPIIINDPIYGFITIADTTIAKILHHPYFQRLHHIKQLALAHFVYPGAVHSRFHHSLGAYHLMCQALSTLREKGIKFNKEEALAVKIAILLHDSGHTPFSHSLEHTLMPTNTHEECSLQILSLLQEEDRFSKEEKELFNLAKSIFSNTYNRPFLSQLISSQIDTDRMDYLTRDSFYTGVAEGIIGYDRIIRMLYVKDENLIIESKGLYAVEKFIIARYFMHWQVYQHKKVWALGRLMSKIFIRIKELMLLGKIEKSALPTPLFSLLQNNFSLDKKSDLNNMLLLDDTDIWVSIKNLSTHPDIILQLLVQSILKRGYKIKIIETSSNSDTQFIQKKKEVQKKLQLSDEEIKHLFFEEQIHIPLYDIRNKANEVYILGSDSKTHPISENYNSILSYEVPHKKCEGKIYQVSIPF